VPYPCVGDSTTCSLLTGWQAIQIATMPWIVPVSPGTSQAKTCKMKSVIFIWSGMRTKLQYSFRMDGILLKVGNWKERCYAWIFKAATSHIWTWNCSYSQGPTKAIITLFILSPGNTAWHCQCVPNLDQICSYLWSSSGHVFGILWRFLPCSGTF
jgi:hypothetical protein